MIELNSSFHSKTMRPSVIREEFESWAIRLMEKLRLKVIEQINDFFYITDIDRKLQTMMKELIIEMGIKPNDFDFAHFMDYINQLSSNTSLKSGKILSDIKTGIHSYLIHENDNLLLDQINLNFDGHVGLSGQPREVNAELYIQIMNKILAHKRYLTYHKVQRTVNIKRQRKRKLTAQSRHNLDIEKQKAGAGSMFNI